MWWRGDVQVGGGGGGAKKGFVESSYKYLFGHRRVAPKQLPTIGYLFLWTLAWLKQVEFLCE